MKKVALVLALSFLLLVVFNALADSLDVAEIATIDSPPQPPDQHTPFCTVEIIQDWFPLQTCYYLK